MRLFTSSARSTADPTRTRKLEHSSLKAYYNSLKEAYREWWDSVDEEDGTPKPQYLHLYVRVFKKDGSPISKWGTLFFYNGELCEKLMREDGTFSGMHRIIPPESEEHLKIRKAIKGGRVELYYDDKVSKEILLGRRLTAEEIERIKNTRR